MCVGVCRCDEKEQKTKVAGGRGQIRKVRSPSREEVRFGRSRSSEMNMNILYLPLRSPPSTFCDCFVTFFFLPFYSDYTLP